MEVSDACGRREYQCRRRGWRAVVEGSMNMDGKVMWEVEIYVDHDQYLV